MKKIYRLMPLALIVCVSFCPIEKTAPIQQKNLTNTKFSEGIDTNKISLNMEAVHTKSALEVTTEIVYNSINPKDFSLPRFTSFSKAFSAYYELEQDGLVQNNILTVIDFGLSSTQNRLWVIDMSTNEVVLESLVAHGMNSGSEFATSFSNKLNSFQSSLGAYLTGETYEGKHGFSMRLDGVEKDVNHMARERAVVVHAADYVSESFIQKNGKLGRSQGCPAVPAEVNKKLINLIKDQSVLYIYHPSLDKKKQTSDSKLFS